MRSATDVLVVEDEDVVFESVKRILVPEGFSVDGAGSAEEATHKLQQREYGIALVDIVLPGVSGLQLTEFLRKSQPELVTIAFSGLATRESVIESFRCGAFDFIPKPFSFEELLGPVQRAVGFLQRGAIGRQQAGGPDAARNDAANALSGALSDCYFLGDHIWTRFRDDGSAVIGVDDTFGPALEQVDTVDYPGAFEEIKQGHACVRITTKQKIVHTVWCAISGVVVASNAPIAAGGGAAGARAAEGTWLVRVWPRDREEEMGNLNSYAHQ